MMEWNRISIDDFITECENRSDSRPTAATPAPRRDVDARVSVTLARAPPPSDPRARRSDSHTARPARRRALAPRVRSQRVVREALLVGILRMLVIRVLLELHRRGRGDERLEAHLALDVHRLRVVRELAPCGVRDGRVVSRARVGGGIGTWRINGGGRAGERGKISGAARGGGRAPFDAVFIFSCFICLALADFCALPPPIVNVYRAVGASLVVDGERRIRLTGARLAENR